jgi:hypothetical protein
MKFNKLSKNTVEVVVNDNAKVLYSNNKPVAVFYNKTYYKTNSKLPPTTHILANKWVKNPVHKNQFFFDNFMARFA